jgi:hypothetical protein
VVAVATVAGSVMGGRAGSDGGVAHASNPTIIQGTRAHRMAGG